MLCCVQSNLVKIYKQVVVLVLSFRTENSPKNYLPSYVYLHTVVVVVVRCCVVISSLVVLEEEHTHI